MKKFAGMLVAFIAVFSLTACGSKADFTCTGKVEGQEATVTGTVKDGKVTTINMKMVAEASSEDEAKQAAAMYTGFGALGASNGITMSAKANGKKVTVTTEVDVEKAKKEEEAEDDDDEMSFTSDIDLSDASKDAVIKYFEKQGLTCK